MNKESNQLLMSDEMSDQWVKTMSFRRPEWIVMLAKDPTGQTIVSSNWTHHSLKFFVRETITEKRILSFTFEVEVDLPVDEHGGGDVIHQ